MPWKSSDLFPDLKVSDPARNLQAAESLPGWAVETERPAPGKGDRLVTAAQPIVTQPAVKAKDPGIMGQSWGMLTPEQSRADLTARRAQYDDISKRLTQYDRMIATANEYSRPQLEAQRTALAADLPDLKQLEAMEAGTAPLATKTPLRAGAENIVRSAGENLLSVPEYIGIAKGYLTPGQVDDDSLLKWSLATKESLEQMFPGDAARQQDFSQQLASGLGQIATFYGTGALATVMKAGPRLATALVAALGGTATGASGFEEATAELKKAQQEAATRGDAAAVTELDRLAKTLGYTGVGLTEAIPVARTFGRAVPTPATNLQHRLIQAGEGAAEEALQESGSQLAQNVITQQTTDPKRSLTEGVASGAGVGGVLGGLMGAIMPGRFVPATTERRDYGITDAPLEGFYSPGQRVVGSVKQEKMPASQWVGALEKQDPAAGREARDLGLDIWLQEQGGGKAVTRQEVKDWLDAHQVEVETRTFTEDDLRQRSSRIRPHGENYGETILKPKGLDYNSKHFNDNEVVIVSHADRTGPNGERYFATEQVQSDLHQRGRKEGYRDASVERKLDELTAQFGLPKENYKDNAVDRKFDRLLDQLGDLPDTDPRKPELRNALQIVKAHRWADRFKIPSAPFKGDLWWQLGLKWAISNAARNGYDGVVVARADQAAQASMGNEQKLGTLYNKKVPDWLKKYVKSLGGELVQEAIPNYGPQQSRLEINSGVDGQAILDFLTDYAQNGLVVDEDGRTDYVRLNVLDTIVNGLTPNLARSFAAEFATEGFAGQKIPELIQGFTRKDGTFVPGVAQPIKNWVIKLTPEMTSRVTGRGQSQYAAKPGMLRRGLNQLRPGVTIDDALDTTSAREQAALLVGSGRTVNVPDAATQPILDAAEALGPLIPVPVAVLTKLESLTKNKVQATYRTKDGRTRTLVTSPDELFTSRAFTETDGAGRSVIFFPRFNGAETGDSRVVGELWHETVHALRRQNLLFGSDWARLLSHAGNLRILDMDFRDFLGAIKSPKWEEAPAGVSIRELYEDLYADQYRDDPSGLEQAVLEEGVSHMVELAQHGVADLEAVQDIIDRMQTGQMTTVAPGAPKHLDQPIFQAASNTAVTQNAINAVKKEEIVTLIGGADWDKFVVQYPTAAEAVIDILGTAGDAQSIEELKFPVSGKLQTIGFALTDVSGTTYYIDKEGEFYDELDEFLYEEGLIDVNATIAQNPADYIQEAVDKVQVTNDLVKQGQAGKAGGQWTWSTFMNEEPEAAEKIEEYLSETGFTFKSIDQMHWPAETGQAPEPLGFILHTNGNIDYFDTHGNHFTGLDELLMDSGLLAPPDGDWEPEDTKPWTNPHVSVEAQKAALEVLEIGKKGKPNPALAKELAQLDTMATETGQMVPEAPNEPSYQDVLQELKKNVSKEKLDQLINGSPNQNTKDWLDTFVTMKYNKEAKYPYYIEKYKLGTLWESDPVAAIAQTTINFIEEMSAKPDQLPPGWFDKAKITQDYVEPFLPKSNPYDPLPEPKAKSSASSMEDYKTLLNKLGSSVLDTEAIDFLHNIAGSWKYDPNDPPSWVVNADASELWQTDVIGAVAKAAQAYYESYGAGANPSVLKAVETIKEYVENGETAEQTEPKSAIELNKSSYTAITPEMLGNHAEALGKADLIPKQYLDEIAHIGMIVTQPDKVGYAIQYKSGANNEYLSFPDFKFHPLKKADIAAGNNLTLSVAHDIKEISDKGLKEAANGTLVPIKTGSTQAELINLLKQAKEKVFWNNTGKEQTALESIQGIIDHYNLEVHANKGTKAPAPYWVNHFGLSKLWETDPVQAALQTITKYYEKNYNDFSEYSKGIWDMVMTWVESQPSAKTPQKPAGPQYKPLPADALSTPEDLGKLLATLTGEGGQQVRNTIEWNNFLHEVSTPNPLQYWKPWFRSDFSEELWYNDPIEVVKQVVAKRALQYPNNISLQDANEIVQATADSFKSKAPKPLPAKFSNVEGALKELTTDYENILDSLSDKLIELSVPKVLWKLAPEFMTVGNEVAAFAEVIRKTYLDPSDAGQDPYASELEKLAIEKLYYDLHPKTKPAYSSPLQAIKEAPGWIAKLEPKISQKAFLEEYSPEATDIFGATSKFVPGEGNWVVAHAVNSYFELNPTEMQDSEQLRAFLASFLPKIIPFKTPSQYALKKSAGNVPDFWELNPEEFHPAKYDTIDQAKASLGKFARNIVEELPNISALTKKYAAAIPETKEKNRLIAIVNGYAEEYKGTLLESVYNELKDFARNLQPQPKSEVAAETTPESPGVVEIPELFKTELSLPPQLSYAQALMMVQSNVLVRDDVKSIFSEIAKEYAENTLLAQQENFNTETAEYAAGLGEAIHKYVTKHAGPNPTGNQRQRKAQLEEIADSLMGIGRAKTFGELNQKLKLDFTQRNFTFSGKAGGGTKPKEIWTDEFGKEYLFKPVQATKKYLADAEVFGGKVSQILNPESAPAIFPITLNDRYGSLQQFKPSQGDLGGTKVESLPWIDMSRLMREHVIDWLISNHDGHLKQFLRGNDGSIIAIDKGQAFKFFGKDKLTTDYHPNPQEHEPVYNKLWRAFKDGKLTAQIDEATGGPSGVVEEAKKQITETEAERKQWEEISSKRATAELEVSEKIYSSPFNNSNPDYDVIIQPDDSYFNEVTQFFKDVSELIKQPFATLQAMPQEVADFIEAEGQNLYLKYLSSMADKVDSYLHREGLGSEYGTIFSDDFYQKHAESFPRALTDIVVNNIAPSNSYNRQDWLTKNVRNISSERAKYINGHFMRADLQQRLQDILYNRLEVTPGIPTKKEAQQAATQIGTLTNKINSLQNNIKEELEGRDNAFFQPVFQAITDINNRLPDSLFLQLLEPYAKSRFPDPVRREAFTNYALDRKRNLAKKFWNLFFTLTDPRNRAIGNYGVSKQIAEEAIKKDPEFKSPDFTEAELSILHSYTGSSYKSMNKAMKTGQPINEHGVLDLSWVKTAASVETLARALKKLPPYTGIAHRGQDWSNDLSQFKTGKIWNSKGFLSTSADINSAFSGKIKFVINSLTGRYIDDYSTAKGEKEVLFLPDTNFLITKIIVKPGSTTGEENYTIYMEELPEIDFGQNF